MVSTSTQLAIVETYLCPQIHIDLTDTVNLKHVVWQRIMRFLL
ncbi:hypothetical protein [Shewanella sp. CAL98-MNA-CIBAN-0140]